MRRKPASREASGREPIRRDASSDASSDAKGRAGSDGHLRYLLSAYVFGDISAAGRREVEQHLEGCESCRAELGDLRATLALVETALVETGIAGDEDGDALDEGESEGRDGAGGVTESKSGYSFEARRLERVLAVTRARASRSTWMLSSIAALLPLSVLGFLWVLANSYSHLRVGDLEVAMREADYAGGEDPEGWSASEDASGGLVAARRPGVRALSDRFRASGAPAGVAARRPGVRALSDRFRASGAPAGDESFQQVGGRITALPQAAEATVVGGQDFSKPLAAKSAEHGSFGYSTERVEEQELAKKERADSKGLAPAEGPSSGRPALASTPERDRFSADGRAGVGGLGGGLGGGTRAAPAPATEPPPGAKPAATGRGIQYDLARTRRDIDRAGVFDVDGEDSEPVPDSTSASTPAIEAAEPAAVQLAVRSRAEILGGAPFGFGSGAAVQLTVPSRAEGLDAMVTVESRSIDISDTFHDSTGGDLDGRPPIADSGVEFDADPSRNWSAALPGEDPRALFSRLDDIADANDGYSIALRSAGELGAGQQGQGQAQQAGGQGGGAKYYRSLEQLAELAAAGGALRVETGFEIESPILRERSITAGKELAQLDKRAKSLQDLTIEERSYARADGAAGEPVEFQRESEESEGKLGAHAAAAPELGLRAYFHWRRSNPELTPEAFRARPMRIAPPVIGDEGLGAEGFLAKHGVHPFVDTRTDRFSTFGMDVDTAAWSKTRAFLREGRLPEPSSVHVEEFVNSFPEETAADIDPDEVFSVWSEGGPSPFGLGLDLVKITIKSRELRAGERKDAVLTFAIDTSGSMALPPVEANLLEDRPRIGRADDTRIGLVRDALGTLVDSLAPSDRVGVVAFSDRAWVVLPHTSVRDKDSILASLDGLATRGGTHLEAGLDLAYRLADESRQDGAISRVILCSDGVANLGASDPEPILERVRLYARRGVYLSAVGVGVGTQDDKLPRRLADEGNGNYSYVANHDDAARVFRDNLPATLQVLAKDAKIQVELDPTVVRHYRLLGYEKRDIADRDFRNDKVDAGEVGPGTTVTVLYEIIRHPNAVGALGKIRLRYLDTGLRRVEEREFDLPVGLIARDLSETSDRFRFIAAVAELAELLRDSHFARDGSFGAVARLLESLSEEYKNRADFGEVAEITRLAAGITVRSLMEEL